MSHKKSNKANTSVKADKTPQEDKTLGLRIAVLIVAAVIILGIVIMPLL
ncbi:MAG: hypothetical protein IJX77_02570 [Ruminococcus sp.]|nr:hypothetical protein [Ruminococcus sp.]